MLWLGSLRFDVTTEEADVIRRARVGSEAP